MGFWNDLRRVSLAYRAATAEERRQARHAAAGTGLELVLTALVVLLLLGLMALA